MKATVKVTANQSKKTFTIRKYYNGKLSAKFRTMPLQFDEFEDYEMNTENDWINFLRTEDYNYYTVSRNF